MSHFYLLKVPQEPNSGLIHSVVPKWLAQCQSFGAVCRTDRVESWLAGCPLRMRDVLKLGVLGGKPGQYFQILLLLPAQVSPGLLRGSRQGRAGIPLPSGEVALLLSVSCDERVYLLSKSWRRTTLEQGLVSQGLRTACGPKLKTARGSEVSLEPSHPVCSLQLFPGEVAALSRHSRDRIACKA